MKFIGLIFFLLPFSSMAANSKAIYGADNRLNLFQIDQREILEAAAATAIMVKEDKLHAAGHYYQIESERFGERLPMCPEEDFLQEPSLGECSGFLVANDLILTAGHCVGSKYDCKKAKWIFDYAYISKQQGLDKISKEQVYGCRNIIDKEENSVTAMDYSLIQLDRKVTGRHPLRLSFDQKIDVGTPLILIGNPAGLPTKVAQDAYVSESKHKNYFIADTDSFQGSSGSAVLNAETLNVEGILVRGEEDYVPDHERKCLKVKQCRSIDECRGEDVIRIKSIPEIERHL